MIRTIKLFQYAVSTACITAILLASVSGCAEQNTQGNNDAMCVLDDTGTSRLLEIMRKQVEEDGGIRPQLFGFDPLPPDYDTLLAQAQTWSDEELTNQLTILTQKYQTENEWIVFFRNASYAKSFHQNGYFGSKKTREEWLLVSMAIGANTITLKYELQIPTKHRSSDEFLYARNAGWIDELSKRRRRLTRSILEDIYDVPSIGQSLNDIWDPTTETVLELEDLVSSDDETNQ